MSAPSDAVLDKVGKWMTHGDQDLELARHALTIEENCPYHLAAYHAQQCAEKYLKAYLVFNLVDFPYTHNLLRLIELCPAQTRWADEISAAAALSSYATAARYPGEDEPVTEDEVRQAIRIAEHVRKVMRRVLASSAIAEGVESGARKAWTIRDAEWGEASAENLA